MEIVMSHLPKSRRKYVVGAVVSDKMDKTIVVRVNRRALHPLYKKYVTISKNFKAHDPDNRAKIGDTVRVIESRPISKQKRWRLYQIVNTAGESEGVR